MRTKQQQNNYNNEKKSTTNKQEKDCFPQAVVVLGNEYCWGIV